MNEKRNTNHEKPLFQEEMTNKDIRDLLLAMVYLALEKNENDERHNSDN